MSVHHISGRLLTVAATADAVVPVSVRNIHMMSPDDAGTALWKDMGFRYSLSAC